MDIRKQTTRLALLAILLSGWGLYLWGIVRDLPYEPFVDEPIYVTRAIQMAATGDLNPHWFGNPASTTIYPLAGLFHLSYAITHRGSLGQANPGLATDFAGRADYYYLLGRLLSAAYGIFTLPLLVLLGRRIFGTRTGLLAAGLLLFYPILLWHTQVVRTDTSALFFVTLSLWLCYRAVDQPRPRHFMLAGAAIGLAIASRYLMASLYFVYLALFLLRTPAWQREGKTRYVVTGFVAGALVSVVTFALSSPFVLLDWTTAWQNITAEARSVHLGADGKNYAERAIWYLSSAIPASVYGGQMLALGIGVVACIRQRNWDRLVLVLFIVVFVATISLPSLHWSRWIIQILPVLALLGAYGAQIAVGYALRWFAPSARPLLTGLALVAILAQPLYKTVQADLKLGSTSTRIEARHWIEAHLPAGSRLIAENGTAPLNGTTMIVEAQPVLAEQPFAYYVSADFDFVMTSSEISNRFVADAERYAAQLAFYAQLSELPLLQEFIPDAWQGGPSIRIFRLPKGEE